MNAKEKDKIKDRLLNGEATKKETSLYVYYTLRLERITKNRCEQAGTSFELLGLLEE